jgi:hypothetical protein
MFGASLISFIGEHDTRDFLTEEPVLVLPYFADVSTVARGHGSELKEDFFVAFLRLELFSKFFDCHSVTNTLYLTAIKSQVLFFRL